MSGFRENSAAVAKTWFREKRIQGLGYAFQREFYKSKFTIQNNVQVVIL